MTDRLQDALVRASYEVLDSVADVAARHDLSMTLLRVIGILRDRTPTMSELADHLGLDRSSITGLVDRAAARGLLQKVTDTADRRAVRVRLTPAGRNLADTGVTEIREALAPLVDHLDSDARGALTALLETLTDAR
ncbi:MAG: MarR family transcriptional regulator [Gordonia sp. (in: high G+C Gram-positive bacteria)]|uniref:MarR family winged helix-turn-helix transcriptional regulator n=1 Tax=Gordonia sp. (in: high G+C Gram-positive bacteria) TaxID=84139 RepID=UPI0039E41B01